MHHHTHHVNASNLARQEQPVFLANLSLDAMTDASDCSKERAYERAGTGGELPYCTDFSMPLVGKWMEDADPTRRANFQSCPLIASQYACSFIGLRHGFVTERMRWAPTHCKLRGFCGATIAHLLRRRRLVVVGDSHARQVYSSLACKLYISGLVTKITGPCNSTVVKKHASPNYPRESLACLEHGQFTNNRVLCGPQNKCTGGPMSPREALQAGPATGTNVFLRDGGILMYREPVGAAVSAGADTRAWASGFYQRTFTQLNAELKLTAEDVIVVSDIGAARHASEGRVLAALADSYVASTRSLASHVIWVDAMAPHFARSADGEFANQKGRDSARSCRGATPPKPHRVDVDSDTLCRPHTCDAQGASNVPTFGRLNQAGLPILHSFHASRTAHIAHHGRVFTNYSAWKMPDCHHVCQPSGPDELRVSLLYNMLVSGYVFAATARRRNHTSMHARK